MTQIQQTKRLFDIEQVSSGYTQDIPDFLTANFVLDAFYLPPISEISKIEEPLPEFTDAEKNVLAGLSSMPYISVYQEGSSGSASLPLGKTNLFE